MPTHIHVTASDDMQKLHQTIKERRGANRNYEWTWQNTFEVLFQFYIDVENGEMEVNK